MANPTNPIKLLGGDASVVTTGGTAVNAVLASEAIHGGYIVNPLTAADQGIAVVEPLYIDPVAVGGATTSANGTCVALQPGDPYYIPPGCTSNISVNAATSGHKFSVVKAI